MLIAIGNRSNREDAKVAKNILKKTLRALRLGGSFSTNICMLLIAIHRLASGI
ncbi:MAG: hypothetical protein JRI93_13755 [Deltaproteobacteria bacterium]|nr:hypothetical protein [Deltaproteobacteria bacterium]